MTNPIKGIVAVISGYGVGKTTFALECGYHPKDIIFVNDDVKETGIDRAMFKQYVDLVSISAKTTIVNFHEKCNQLIEKLPKSRVIIWDTWTQYQDTFPAYVKANPAEFRTPREYSSMGKIKAGEQYKDAYRYEGFWLSALRDKCDLLILTFHLKQKYLNGVALDKMQPGHDRAIEKYADLRIWLTHNPDSQVPAGLVLKNINKRSVTKQGIKTQQILPLRIGKCNWENILGYYESPIGNRELLPDERPNEFEYSLIEGTLTEEDKRLYEASLPLIEKQEDLLSEEENLMRQTQENSIKEWIRKTYNSGVTPPSPVLLREIEAKISSGELEYSNNLTIGKIAEWSK